MAIPDTAASVTATGEWRCNYNLAPGPLDPTLKVWDMDIVLVASGVLPLVWRAYKPGEQPSPGSGWRAESYPWAPGGAVAPLRQVDQYRTTYLGLTLYLNAPAIADQGRIIVGQVPNLLEVVTRSTTTIDPTAAARRMLDALQTRSETELARALRANDTLVTEVHQEVPPLSEAELTQYSPQTYVSLAKGGCYAPVKFIQPTHNYVDVAASLGTLFWRLSDGTLVPPVPGTSGWQVVGGLNTQTTVILIRGIADASSVFLKMRHGFEAVAAPDSILTAFQYESVIADPQALVAVAAAQQLTPSAYPASANDFLGVLKSIGRALTGRVAQGIAGFLQKSGIPVVSQLAGPVAGVMKAANSLL